MDAQAKHDPGASNDKSGSPPRLERSVVLVGLMGAGKTAVGRRLASSIGARFEDADEAVAEAAGMSIPDIFEAYGETVFRDLERRVIARLLEGEPHVLALGGGAFIDPATRSRVERRACSLWLRADLETLINRTSKRRASRPLLVREDPRIVLARLMAERYPVYGEADYTVDSGDQPAEQVVQRVRQLLSEGGVLRGAAVPGADGAPDPAEGLHE